LNFHFQVVAICNLSLIAFLTGLVYGRLFPFSIYLMFWSRVNVYLKQRVSETVRMLCFTQICRVKLYMLITSKFTFTTHFQHFEMIILCGIIIVWMFHPVGLFTSEGWQHASFKPLHCVHIVGRPRLSGVYYWFTRSDSSLH